MGALSPMHLILILIIALFVIGPGKLPETGAALGKALRQFREATNGTDEPKDVTPGADGPKDTPKDAPPQA